MPMQYTAIFKTKKLQFSVEIFLYFLIFAQNIDCEYA